MFMKAFITTYKSFTTPEILLNKLIERYDASFDVGLSIGLNNLKVLKFLFLKFRSFYHPFFFSVSPFSKKYKYVK